MNYWGSLAVSTERGLCGMGERGRRMGSWSGFWAVEKLSGMSWLSGSCHQRWLLMTAWSVEEGVRRRTEEEEEEECLVSDTPTGRG